MSQLLMREREADARCLTRDTADPVDSLPWSLVAPHLLLVTTLGPRTPSPSSLTLTSFCTCAPSLSSH